VRDTIGSKDTHHRSQAMQQQGPPGEMLEPTHDGCTSDCGPALCTLALEDLVLRLLHFFNLVPCVGAVPRAGKVAGNLLKDILGLIIFVFLQMDVHHAEHEKGGIVLSPFMAFEVPP
jgi:hypothetical protein